MLIISHRCCKLAFMILEMLKLRDLRRVFGCSFRCDVRRIGKLCNWSYNEKYS